MSEILELIEWSRQLDFNRKPWLVLGKGPTFGKVGQVDLDQYFVCTLNHVIREVPADLAHIIDLDVVQDCADAIYRNAKTLVLPFYPHVNCRPTTKSIKEFLGEIPVLRKLASEGRLVWYNLATSKKKEGDSPTVAVKFFSAEAALNLLASIGVKVVRSLGVDGGTNYSNDFADLSEKTRLANGHESFDKQFAGIARTIRTTGIFYAPLHIQAPVRVFVGADAAQVAGVKVLEYSIKKFASLSVDVQIIDDRDVPIPTALSNRSRTGFSFSRFHIPKLCGYRGRAIYLDADMQVFTDIRKLWTLNFGEADVLYAESNKGGARIPQFSVMLLNCANLDWDVREIVENLDNGVFDYNQLMQQLCILPAERRRPALPFEWNSLEHYEAGKTNLIHYTDMPTQPWISNRNPNGQLWYDCCREAIDEGFLSRDFLYDEVEKGNVSPELPGWLGLPPPADIKAKRKSWTPPFKRFVSLPKVPQLGLDATPGEATAAHTKSGPAGPSGAIGTTDPSRRGAAGRLLKDRLVRLFR
ncbi:MAG: glycosyltransferase [Porticoccaceae bacterium]